MQVSYPRYYSSVFAKKLINGLTHCNIIVAPDSSLRRTRHSRLYKLPKVRTEIGRKRFTYVAKLLGNNIDDAYSPHTSIAKLKKRTRSFLCDDVTRYSRLLNTDKWYWLGHRDLFFVLFAGTIVFCIATHYSIHYIQYFQYVFYL